MFFFPSFYTSTDEHEFLKASVAFSNLDFFEENRELSCNGTSTEFGYLPRSFYLKPIFMVPFQFFGLAGVMLSGLVIHLLNFFILAAIFRKMKIDLRFLVLYLFFPAFVWSARTIFAELLVVTFLLLSYYFYTANKKRLFVSGLFFGFAFLTRFEVALAFLAFLIPLLYDWVKDKKFEKPVYFAAGFVPSALFFLISNFLIFGNPFRTVYGSSVNHATGALAQQLYLPLLPKMILFALLLLLVYPLMLLVPFFAKENKRQLVLLTFSYLFFTSKFGGFFPFGIGTFRYLIPLIALLLIPYSKILQSLLEKFNLMKPKIFYLVLIPFILAAVFVSYSHSEVLDNRYATFNIIHDNTPDGSLVIGSSDDCIYFQKNFFPNKSYMEINEYLETGPDLEYENIYFVTLSYSYRADRDSSRQDIIESERKPIYDFIEENQDGLKKVFSTTDPNQVDIYKLS